MEPSHSIIFDSIAFRRASFVASFSAMDLRPRDVFWNEKMELEKAVECSLAQRRRHHLYQAKLDGRDITEVYNYFEDMWDVIKELVTWPKLSRQVTREMILEAAAYLEKPKIYQPPRRRILMHTFHDECVDDVLPIAAYSDTGSHRGFTPPDFEYHEYFQAFEQKSVPRAKQHGDLIVKCECVGSCEPENCPCQKMSRLSKSFFLLDGRVWTEPRADSTNSVVIMCGDECECSHNCNKRLDNMKLLHKLEIFRRDDRTGFGVRTLSPIRVGDVICEFKGIIVNRNRLQEESQAEYSFQVEEKENMELINHLRRWSKGFVPGSESKWDHYLAEDMFVNPFHFGNVGRFLLHGCFPNTKMIRITGNFLAPRKHKLFLAATLPIPAGMELTFDYGSTYLNAMGFDCCCNTLTCKTNEEYWSRVNVQSRRSLVLKYMRTLRTITQKQIREANERFTAPITLDSDSDEGEVPPVKKTRED